MSVRLCDGRSTKEASSGVIKSCFFSDTDSILKRVGQIPNMESGQVSQPCIPFYVTISITIHRILLSEVPMHRLKSRFLNM